MRIRLMGKVAAAAFGLGLAALVAAGPAAAQENAQGIPGGEYLTLSPSTVAPGHTVTITMGCDTEVLGAGVTSAITGTTLLTPTEHGPASFNYHGTVRIPEKTRHGTYEFTGGCGSPAFLVVAPGGHGPAGGTGLDRDNGALFAAGAGALALAVAGGGWLYRRRATGAAA
ncbi:MAG TPA: hypothetical protein VIL37_18825 [Natronosporangium sp.]